MNEDKQDTAVDATAGGIEYFREIRQLTNHWARPSGVRAYYWYLTFDGATALQELASQCQEVMSCAYYDPVPPD